MPEKSRPFSIYLLRIGYDAANALDDDHDLVQAQAPNNVPPGSTLFILDAERKRPWWRAYFGVQEDIWQETKGAMLFLPTGGRCFALAFGQVQHNLRDIAYEYDFGLRVTLNTLDPNELRSADMVEPGPARRKRMQVPVSTDLTYLDFDGNSEVIKSLTGQVKAEYRELFKTASGAASLKVSLKLNANQLSARCEQLLALYDSDAYRDTFPNIENITPVRNPVDIAPLDQSLLQAIQQRSLAATLNIPDIVDYEAKTCCIFYGAGPSTIHPDIAIEKFYEYVGDDIQQLTLDELKHFKLILTDVDGEKGRSYGLYRSLIFDVENPGEDVIHHFCDGSWYRVDKAFATRIRNYLDAKCEFTDLQPYNHDAIKDGHPVYSEGSYNSAMAAAIGGLICLDRKDVSPQGATQIEPCDLYVARPDAGTASGQRGHLYHIKISTRSAHLSHLFSQGVGSVALFGQEAVSRQKMTALITAELGNADPSSYVAPLEPGDFKVIYGIITHKNPNGGSGNLPLFSKLSLMHAMRTLDMYKVPSALTFIPDQSPPKGGHSHHTMYLVEVHVDDGKHVVRPVAESGLNPALTVRGCPKAVSQSDAGTRFQLAIKVSDDPDEGAKYSSFHSWPYEEAA